VKNNIPFYDKLHFRVTVLMAIVVILVEIIVGLTVLTLAKDKFRHTMHDSFNTTVAMAENFFSLVGQMGLGWNRHFIEGEQLAAVLERQGKAEIPDFVARIKDESTADIVILLDNKGRVIADTEKPERRGESLKSWQMVRKAVSDREAMVSVIQDINSLIIYSPSLLYSKNGDSLIGVVLAGYVINDELISGMKKDTLTDITIVRRRGVMASTYNTQENRLIDIPVNYITYQSLLAEENNKDNIGNMRINDVDYFISARRLSLMDPAMDGSILLSYPQSELQAVIEDLINRLLIISGVSFVLILFISWFFAERLLAPLRRLLVHTQGFETDNTVESIHIKERGEVGVLTQRFNTLLHSIKQKNKALQAHGDELEQTVKQRTQALLQSNEDLLKRRKSLADAQRIANLGSWEWSAEDDSIRCSKQIYRILGIEELHALTTLQELFEYIHKDDREAVHEMMEHISSDSENEIEFRICRPDGTQRTVNSEMEIVTDEADKHRNLTATLQDITERKQAEDNQAVLQRQLQHAQKMEAIGQLTGGIAHDFNNMLASIMGYTELARDELVQYKNEEIEDYLNEVYKSSNRARDLVVQMLAFSRGSEEKLELLILASSINESLKMLGSTLPSSIEIELQLDDDNMAIMSNPAQLHQLIMHLCINARDAMQGKGHITIGLQRVNNIMTECRSCHEEVKGDYIQLFVRDNGPGITTDQLERIFDPFYTSKKLSSDKGTGMGLAVVHGIMHSHGGHIVVETAVGKGTTFSLLFPVIEARPDSVNITE